MKKLLGILVLGLLWCNISFAEFAETIIIKSYPDGAECTLKNGKNDLKVTTESRVMINLSKKKLKVTCSYPDFKTKTVKLPLRRIKDLPSFNFDLSEVKGIKQINEFTEAACFGAEVANNPISDAICFGIDMAAIGVYAVGNVVKKAGALFSKKTFGTHTYANSIVNGANSVIITLSKN